MTERQKALDGRRRSLDISIALSKAEIHWREFLENLADRGQRGGQLITSDDHPGLKAARRAVLGGVIWQRCRFHLVQNAIHHAPAMPIRKRIGSQLRDIWNGKTPKAAENLLNELVASYRDHTANLAHWLEKAIPEGLAVFALPEAHRKRLRTSNPIERAIQQELKRRTIKVRVFTNDGAMLRLVSAPRRDRRNLASFNPALHQLEQLGRLIRS